MTNRAQITRQAARDGAPAPTVERDYVLAHIIAALGALETTCVTGVQALVTVDIRVVPSQVTATGRPSAGYIAYPLRKAARERCAARISRIEATGFDGGQRVPAKATSQ